jgi:hypothetical protein
MIQHIHLGDEFLPSGETEIVKVPSNENIHLPKEKMVANKKISLDANSVRNSMRYDRKINIQTLDIGYAFPHTTGLISRPTWTI